MPHSSHTSSSSSQGTSTGLSYFSSAMSTTSSTSDSTYVAHPTYQSFSGMGMGADPGMGQPSGVIPNHIRRIYPYRYRTTRNQWKHYKPEHPSEDDVGVGPRPPLTATTPRRFPESLKIVSWNIDFANPAIDERLEGALKHLQKEVIEKDPSAPGVSTLEPCCILLQEVEYDAFEVLLNNEWIRKNFYIAPVTPDAWPSKATYGLVTLVERSLEIRRVQMLEFGWSTMQRGGLMVDVVMFKGGKECVVRITNTHLESLPKGANARPHQLELLADFLRKSKEVDGGLIAGDMNSISPSDAHIAHDVGLRDAWRGSDDEEEGFTWGYQGGGSYPAARLDKVLYLRRPHYKVTEPKRVGVGACVNVDGQNLWISDHYGLCTTLRLRS